MTEEDQGALEERKQFIRAFVAAHPLETSGAKLYAALIDRYPDQSAGDHQHTVEEMYTDELPWNRGKTCPNVARGTCETVAKTVQEALALFGHRCKKTQLQSYCKSCRNRARRDARAVRRQKEEDAIAERQRRLLKGYYTNNRRDRERA